MPLADERGVSLTDTPLTADEDPFDPLLRVRHGAVDYHKRRLHLLWKRMGSAIVLPILAPLLGAANCE